MKCFFCGDNIKEGRGKLFVKKSGDALHFCNTKCHKNFNLGRQGKHTKWTKRYEKEKESN